jgi:hypothetical protein
MFSFINMIVWRLWLLQAQAIEHGRVGWLYGDDHRIDDAGAGQIGPLAGAQAVSLGLENPELLT